MTATTEHATAYQVGACQKCHRGGGRERTADVEVAALIPARALLVCDRCWHAAGGRNGVQMTIDDEGVVNLELRGSAEFEALLDEVDDYDTRHPIDRLLIASGIRWATLRHIAGPARCDLVRWVLERAPQASTRVASSPMTWMDAVTERIRQRSGTEFRYACKQHRWRAIANVYAHCAQWNGRPLTWISQEEIAAAIGCSPRTVRRCLVWLQREGLLHEVLPGCQLPRQSRPDDETPAERETRLARYTAAIAAEEAAIAHAHAELDNVRPADALNHTRGGDERDVTVEQDLEEQAAADEAAEWPTDGLIQLVPVYELRVPLVEQDQADEAMIALFCAEAALNAASAGPALTSRNPGATENVHPPQVLPVENLQSRPEQPVDKRPASPGFNKREFDGAARQGEPVRAAQWLLSSRLHPDLCLGVSRTWLAAQIRSSRLISDHEWSWDDLADLIHGVPDCANLPRWIRNPRGWIRARFGLADPHLSPRKQAMIQQIERTSTHLRQRRVAEAEAARQAEIATTRAAIDACSFCDELGWLDLDHTGRSPELHKCTHLEETSGY